jgi:DNA-binding LacI/PurR family transcriptional regulator
LFALFDEIGILLLKFVIDDDTTSDGLCDIFGEKKVGIVIAGNTTQNIIDYFDKNRFSFVSIDNYVKCDGGSYLYIDDYHSSYVITDHLIKTGHKSIHFYIELDSPTNIDKFFGFKKALMEGGLEDEFCFLKKQDKSELSLHYNIDLSKMESFRSFKFPSILPQAFLFSSDHAAANFMMLAINNGYQIPDDFSIASFDNTDICNDTNPKITSIGPDYNLLSRLCYESLLDRFTKRESVFDLRILSSSIIQRDTIKERNN